MKTKDYIEKYSLNVNDKFNHSDFVVDLTADFIAMLEYSKGTVNMKGFDNAVNAIRMKFDAINNKTVGCIPEKLWNYFYATVVMKMKKEFFSDILDQKKAEYDRRKRIREEQNKWEEEQMEYIYNQRKKFFLQFFFGISKPIKEIEMLGLSDYQLELTEDIVLSAYRRLVKVHHPDRGGKQEDFINITSAKEKILGWLSKT